VKEVRDILWTERTREEFPIWVERGAVIIVPIGSTEQHGQHLPVDTDCRTADYVSRMAACTVEDVPILVAPSIPMGISPHHMAFHGTITLRVETLLAVLCDVCESIVAHGFERILIINGHGGNRHIIESAALQLRYDLQRQVQAYCWFDLIDDEMNAVREGPGTSIGHSGELETSVMRFLAPETIRDERLQLVPGVTDDPARSTLPKGEQIMQAAVKAVAKVARLMAASSGHEVCDIVTIRED
jgi:creatinine amidohydrolase